MEPSYGHIETTIVAVRDLTPTVREFRLRRVDGLPLNFVPGEYILYWTGEKYAAFSLASSPLESDEFTIAVAKRGPATEQLHHLNVGETLPIAGPFGPSFDQSLIDGRTLWFVAGGIGLAGLAAQIRASFTSEESSADAPNTSQVSPARPRHRLFYGVRDREEMIWKDDLEQWRSVMTVDVTGDGRHLIGDLIHNQLEVPDDLTVLVCGPRPMAHAVFPILVALGINPRYILTSIW